MTSGVAGTVAGVAVATPPPSPLPTVPPASRTGTGGVGALVLLALILASVGLYFGLRGSLRRLNERKSDPNFGQPRDR